VQRNLSVSFDKLADVFLNQKGLENYQNGLAIAEQQSLQAPKNTEAQRGLSVSYGKPEFALQAIKPKPKGIKLFFKKLC
jgi:hypothetical protein